jgi:hypothetical protein
MSVGQFGRSGTIYDSPPAHPEIFVAGGPDLNVQLGGGFQAAHIWVNNQSNQSLYLPDAPDVVPPGVTRVVAIANTDVGRASWTVPAAFAVRQPPPIGAAILIFLNGGIEIAPTPGVSNQPVQPQTALPDLVFPVGTTSRTTAAAPAGTHSLRLTFASNGNTLANFTIVGGATGAQYYPTIHSGVQFISSGDVLTVLIDSINDTTYMVNFTGHTSPQTVKVTAILDSQAVEVQNHPANPLVVMTPRYGFYAQGQLQVEAQGYIDSQLISAPAIGSAASITFAATAGQKWVVVWGSATVEQTAAVATGVIALTGKDAATVVYEDYLSLVGTASTNNGRPIPPGVQSSVGNALVLALQAVANIAEVISAGGRQRVY